MLLNFIPGQLYLINSLQFDLKITKLDAIIGLYSAGTAISKIIKQLKVSKSTVYDAVRRYKELGNTKDRHKTSIMWYENQHQSRSREGKEGPQMLHEKNRQGPKSMRIILKTDLKLSSLKLKKRQHLSVLQKRKRAGLL